MKPKLPRALLWRDKKTMDELLNRPYGEQLYQKFLTLSNYMRTRFSLGMHPYILNEVFYQCTRVVYERDPDAKVRDYAADIKANMGGLQNTTRLVMMLMMYLLMAQSNRCDEVTAFVKRLRLYYKTPRQFELDLGAEECYLTMYPYENGDEGFFLVPEPCPVDEMEGMVIDWQEVTRGYKKQMIKEVLMLWHNSREQLKVLKMIELAYRKRTPKLYKTKPEDLADSDFFVAYRNELGAVEEDEGPVCEWCGEPISVCREDTETVSELEEKLNRQEKRNNELETELVRLRSELNSRKQKSKQERAFTLKMIVDYCKNRAELRQVEEIIKMLYVFLRKDGNDEEYDLVDSIEEDFRQRLHSMHIDHADVAVGVAEKDSNVHHH